MIEELEEYDYEWNDVDYQRKIEERRISNEDFLINVANERQFRTYIIRELERINSSFNMLDVSEKKNDNSNLHYKEGNTYDIYK